MTETTTLPKKSASTRSSGTKKGTRALSDEAKIVHNQEATVSPLDIISRAGLRSDAGHSPEEEDAMYNPIEKELPQSSFFNGIGERSDIDTSFVLEQVEVPKIRKIAIKKISRFDFRLGMEKSPEQFNIMPGCIHRWMCEKKGNQFLTGLDERPEERKRLERLLRVDLSNTSDYYSSLNFSLEDKEHGQIMNFDDVQMGPYYEVVYYAMLESPLIANGYQEYKNGTKPMAEWYIENKEAEAELKQVDMTYEMEATELFGNTSLSKRHGIAKLLQLNVWGVSEKVASVELWNYVKKNSEQAKAFLQLARLNADELAVSVLVKNAIKLNVLRRNRINDIAFANEVLGPTEEHVISKLILPTNSTLRTAITRLVDAKM